MQHEPYRNYTGIFFVLLSLSLAVAIYCAFGLVFRFEHPFFSTSLLPLFIIAHILLTSIVYVVSISQSLVDLDERGFTKTRTAVVVLVCALAVSALFTLTSYFGLYPATMAMFHLLLLYYCSISIGAIVLATYIVFLRLGAKLGLLNNAIMVLGLVISLGVSYFTLAFFNKFPII